MSRWKISIFGLILLCLFLSACAGTTAPANGAEFSGTINIGDRASSGAIEFAVAEDGSAITNLKITLVELKCGALTVGHIQDYLGDKQIPISEGSFGGSIPALGTGQITESQDYNMGGSPFDFPTFEDMSSVSQLDGKFSSATHASGTIHLYVWAVMTDRACELGEFTWEAVSP